ncbi:MAG: DUF58 domain-containing protein [Acidobacteriota bacterium]
MNQQSGSLGSGRRPIRNAVLDPAVLAGLGNLQLIARAVVEGFLSGLHRSPYHGFSLEFAEYREYSPGDDIRKVDWRVFARTDRFYVKKFEGETNTRLYLLLDASRSMGFSSHGVSKLHYGRMLAAALGYFAIRQNDAPGLITFDEAIRRFTPPRTRPGHFAQLAHHLEHTEPAGSTALVGVLEDFARLIRKRSIVVLISDFYEDVASLARSLRFFHFRGNDVILFQILDPQEVELNLSELTTLEDMETGETLPFSPHEQLEPYARALEEHLAKIRNECRNIFIDHLTLRTDQPLDQALYRYLTARSRRY